MIALVIHLASLLAAPHVAHCAGFLDGVRASGETTCVVRVDAGNENDDPYTETRTPMRITCRRGEIAWLVNLHTAACRGRQ